jgi:hypothetical protein
METLLPVLREQLSSAGIDICEPFRVSAYNQLSKRYPLNTYNRSDSLAVIVGSTKSFWPYFERYIRSFGPDELPKDPMDSFYQKAIDDALKSHPLLASIACEIRYDWSTPRSGKFVHVQTAGHLAGFAYYDQDVFWSCHPEYGLWFVYRAVIVWDVDWAGPSPTPPKSVFDEHTKAEMKKWTEIANSEQWQVRATRLKLRDSCPIGKDKYRYEGDCLSFFFPITETSLDVINRIRSKTTTESTSQLDLIETNTARLAITSPDSTDLISSAPVNLTSSEIS